MKCTVAYEMARRQVRVALVGWALVVLPAHAGRSCEGEHPPKLVTVERGLALAVRTHQALEASGAKVVLLARAGQDLSKYGLRYSHLGFAYQQPTASGGHVWRVLHKLNHCKSDEAQLYRQGLGEFFLDDPWRFEAAWVAPTQGVQARLLALLLDESQAIRLHTRRYSVVAYPWSTRYQQSNQWAIETLAMAMDPSVVSRAQAQGWLQRADYRPTTLKIGALTRLGGRMTAANVAFDDHPNAKRFADRIETVTVDSVFEWLPRAGLGEPAVRLGP